MTEDNDDFDPENPTESLTDVADALESEGATPEPEGEEAEEGDDGGLPGPLSALESLQGTGNSLESYEDSPIAEAIGPEGSKGSLHIARGIDGLSPIGAMNPIIDIGIGVVLIQLERKDSQEGETGDGELEQASPASDPTVDRDSEPDSDLT